MIYNLAVPLVLDSPWTYLPALLTLALIVVRRGLEDRTLLAELPGYRDNATSATMVSGFFTVMSFRSKRGQAFLKDRALRLGIPSLVFGLIMIPMNLFVFAPADGPGPSILPIDVGHLWFLEYLLIFSTGYVLWQTVRGQRAEPKPVPGNPPGYLMTLAAVPTTFLFSNLVRKPLHL